MPDWGGLWVLVAIVVILAGVIMAYGAVANSRRTRAQKELTERGTRSLYNEAERSGR